MRILADENITGRLVEALRAGGHNVEAITEHHRGVSDEEVLRMAIASGRVLLTFDKEFASSIIAAKPPALEGAVLVRLPTDGSQALISRIVQLFENWHGVSGCVTIVRRVGVRIRHLRSP